MVVAFEVVFTMSKEDVLKVQTLTLRVNIHCDGCEKVKKTLHKIDGAYQSSIDAEQGKVTVSGLLDPDTIIRKLNKAGKPAQLWGSKPGVPQNVHHGGGGGKGQPKDAGGKGHSKDGGGGKAQKGGGNHKGGGGGGGKDAKMVLPQPTPQQLQQLQQQLQMKGLKLPPQLLGGNMPAFTPAAPLKDPKSVKFALAEDDFDDDGSEFDDEFDDFDGYDDYGLDDDFYDDPKMMMKPMGAGGGDKKGGKKGGGGNEIPTQSKGNGQGHNVDGRRRTHAYAAEHPTMGLMYQGGGGGGAGASGAVQGMPAPGFYHGGGGMPSGAEMLQAAAAAGNPMASMALMQQQQQMMMNGHGHHHGHDSAGYPSMGYGYGRPPMHYPMGYPMPPPHSHSGDYNIFSDENPNSCSVM
ncbi:unnamed protein product [Miscanthus lutarioriparius]|uniref:HMA domain-containing protein n=1 Tax=Miscanthus lutarioriparius TaxID=422564 RepID=A0A811PV34_9POAL|nr:unnamed protein product [Miscanthus lutarioriparius]